MTFPPQLTAAIDALIPRERSPRRLLIYATVALYEYYLAPDGTVFERDLDSLRSAEPLESIDEIRAAYAEAAKRYPTLAALATIEPVVPPQIPAADWRDRSPATTLPPTIPTPRSPEPTTESGAHRVDVRIADAPTNLDETLAIPGVLAAWDHGDPTSKTLRFFATGVTGARELLHIEVEPPERAAMLERLASRKIRIGACDNQCSYTWAHEPEFELWDESMLILWVVRGGIELAGRRWAIENIARVESFAHAEVTADHGVRLIYDDGTPIVVVAYTPTVERPAWDPFFGGWAEEEMSGAWLWTRSLAQDLAAALRVPYAHVEPR